MRKSDGGHFQIIRKLGRFETAQALTNDCSPFNVVVVLNLSEGPSIEQVEKGLLCIQRFFPALNVNICQKNGTFFFCKSAIRTIPAEFVEWKDEIHWNEIAEGELNRSIDAENDPLMRFIGLVESKSGRKEIRDIILTFHHTIVDAASLTCLLDQFLSWLGKIESSHDQTLHHSILKKASECYFPRRFKGVLLLPGFIFFIFRQISDEIRYRLKSRHFSKPDIRMKTKNRILSMEFPVEFTESLVRRSRAERATLNNVILVAMLRAVSKHLFGKKEGPFRLFLFADLRLYLKPPLPADYLGSYFSMIRFTVPVSFDVDFWEEARELNRKSLLSFKRGDKFYFSLASENIMRTMIRKKNERMGDIALSFTGPSLLHDSYGHVKVKNLHSFVSNFGLGPPFCSQGRIFRGRLIMDYIYLDTDFEKEMAEKISTEICSILKLATGD